MKKYIILCLIMLIGFVWAQTYDPQNIIKQCIEQHGGWKKFYDIRDIYAKMDMVYYADDGKFEVTMHEYYRKPNKLRVEMYSDVNPPVIMGWDGEIVRQLNKDNKLEVTQEQDAIDRIQESLRFIRMMVLTNLLADDSILGYVKYQKKDEFGVHIISQTPKDGQGEKILLFISDKTYTLLGAQFALKNNKNGRDTFMVKFKQHEWYKDMYLPTQTDMYYQNKLIMEVQLRLARTNSLENGNAFFSNLLEKAKFPQKDNTNYRRNN